MSLGPLLHPPGEGHRVNDVAALRRTLEMARSELLATLDGVTGEELLRRPSGGPVDEEGHRWAIPDVLWHVGMYEDWLRRWADAARRGVPPPAWAVRRRPVLLTSPELLRAWLSQTRHTTLVLLEKLSVEDLAGSRILSGGRASTIADALADLAGHDVEHARQVMALRAFPATA